MRLVALSVDHRSADVAVRERIALGDAAWPEIAHRFRDACPGGELVALSTCNRTELYAAGGEDARVVEPEELTRLLASVSGEDPGEVARVARVFEGREAARHLYRVAVGLESMVLGEPQVLGQVKRAYEAADAACLVGSGLHRLFQGAIATAKDARRRTGIGAGQASVGSAAAGFAQQIFERFDDKTVVAVGAGEMAKLTLRHLHGLGPAHLCVLNRSPERARGLAEALDGAEVRSMDALDRTLAEADIVVTSTGAREPLFTAHHFGPALKRRASPLFLIDVAVPRDVEPEVGEMPNVYLYNIDDLQAVVRATHEQRGDEARECDRLTAAAADEAVTAIEHRDVGRLIRRLREKLHRIGEVEKARTQRKIQADPARAEELVSEHTHRLLNKVLHMPLKRLDHREHEETLRFYAQALRALFELEEDAESCPRAEGDSTPERARTEQRA